MRTQMDRLGRLPHHQWGEWDLACAVSTIRSYPESLIPELLTRWLDGLVTRGWTPEEASVFTDAMQHQLLDAVNHHR